MLEGFTVDIFVLAERYIWEENWTCG